MPTIEYNTECILDGYRLATEYGNAGRSIIWSTLVVMRRTRARKAGDHATARWINNLLDSGMSCRDIVRATVNQ